MSLLHFLLNRQFDLTAFKSCSKKRTRHLAGALSILYLNLFFKRRRNRYYDPLNKQRLGIVQEITDKQRHRAFVYDAYLKS